MSPANKEIECATVGGMADNNIGGGEGRGIANTTRCRLIFFNFTTSVQTQIILYISGVRSNTLAEFEANRANGFRANPETDRQKDGKTDGQRFAEL